MAPQSMLATLRHQFGNRLRRGINSPLLLQHKFLIIFAGFAVPDSRSDAFYRAFVYDDARFVRDAVFTTVRSLLN